MKQITLNKTFTLEKEKTTHDKTYGDYVAKTAKLIKQSFIATLRMVENWEPGFMASLYEDCVTKWRNRGFESPAHMWWTERKKLKNSNQTRA